MKQICSVGRVRELGDRTGGLRMVLMQEIDHSLERLDEIIARAMQTRQKYGYFAAVLRRVVGRVKLGIETEKFEDGARMARFESVLVGHYFRAFEAFHSGGVLPQAWDIAFTAAQQDQGTMLQHLMLGMNAHIYLDLGVAAAETMREGRFSTLDHDFSVKNDILFTELEPAKIGFSRFTRLIAAFDAGICGTDVWLAREGRIRFRESSWAFGKKLSEMDPAYWAVAIADRDSLVSELAWQIRAPGFKASVPLALSRLLESRSVARNILRLG